VDGVIIILEVEDMIKVAQDNKVLVKQVEKTTSLGNGLQISNETQNRKDVIVGIVIDSVQVNKIGKKIFFPLYSALPLSYEGENYLVVDTQDILAIELDDPTNNK
jgi:co-chaperonin GroES (HSP10)